MAVSNGAAPAMAGSARENLRLARIALAPGFTRNPGFCPADAEGRRVIVQLADGSIHGREPVTSVTPLGWAADGRNGCRWSLTGQPHDIAGYQVLR